jgi:HK97 family phage major capsid protein
VSQHRTVAIPAEGLDVQQATRTNNAESAMPAHAHRQHIEDRNMKNRLFPADIADADLAHYTAAAADWPGAPVEDTAVEGCEWSTLQGWRNELRALRGELSESSNLSARDQAALKVAARVLQSINAELTARTESGSREPRARSGRQTPAGSSDRHDLPVSADLDGYSLRSGVGAAHDGRFNALFAPASAAAAGGKFRGFGDFCAAVARGKPDQRLMAASMTEGVGGDGGFLVPVEYLGPILDDALRMERVRPYASVIPMASKSAVAGLFDYSDGTNAARGGLRMLWGAEATAMTEQKGKVTDITLTASKANIFVRVSRELVEDAVAFDRQLSQAMRAAVAAGLDHAFVNGNGTAQPLGILNGGSLISVTKESAQSGTFLLQNAAKMVGRLHPSSFARARWLIHPTVVPSLYMMSVTTLNLAGTENVGGGHVAAVSQDANGQLRIFGRPCDISDACAPLGTVGDVILVDWSRYVIGLRRDATLDRDESRYFDSDEVAFRLTLRVDAKPAETAATKLRDGTNTTSAFVVVETR